jgi:branched-chain amino acid transport system substrate-binding protein
MISLPRRRGRRALTALVAIVIAGALTRAEAQGPQPPVKVGVVAYLTGAAAQPFGIPSRNAAELLVDAINAGTLPPPYDRSGLGGARIEAKYLDESGATANVVTEYRNLVQRDGMDAVVGYISSGNCMAVAPVAEELKTLTVMFDCGTPRLFEERDYKYVFRPTPTATMDNVAAARYVTRKNPRVATYAGVNPNYAWGQDSWADFVRSMKVLQPKATPVKDLFPKLFAGEYGTEISTLLTSNAPIVHTSFWDGDLEAFVSQAVARGLPKKMTIVATCGEAQMFRLGSRLPDGTIVGARGPHGVLAPDTELNRWFQKNYTARYGTPPTYPSYHMAQGILSMKAAWDKAAAAKKGARPSIDEVVAAYTGLEYEGPSAHLKLTLGKGHQAVSEIAYGTYRFDKAANRPEIVDVVRYPAECVNPPPNMKTDDWLAAGMPGAKCP